MSNNNDEIEDYLQSKNCFVSGINDRPTHMDSYMTVVSYDAMEKALINSPFTKDQWTEYVNTVSVVSPITKLTIMIIKRCLEL